MGLDRPVQNMRNFLSTRPPLVIFIFCLGMMAVAFISFAYYIKLNNIRNPDTKEDWNTFIKNLTKIHYCPPNGSLTYHLNNTALSDTEDMKNVSLELSISVHLFVPMNSSITFTSFRMYVNGHQMGLSGSMGNRSMELTINPHMPYSPSCEHQNGCLWTMPACLTIKAPKNMFPFSPRPLTCQIKKGNISSISGNLVSIVPTSFTLPPECSSMLIKINHEEDERLFVLLTVDSRSRVHSRLLHSSYFLFIVILTVLVFGLIRGGHHNHDSYGNNRGRSLLSRTSSP